MGATEALVLCPAQLVSHDFRLIDQVAEEIWVCDQKKVTVWKVSLPCI